MRCSLKDGFVILLIFSFTTFEGKGYPLFLYKNSIADRSINFIDLSAMSRVEQILDSFPKLGDYDKNSHKIVKKQMTASDYKNAEKKKRSIFSSQENSTCEDYLKSECREKIQRGMADSVSNGNREKKESTITTLKRRRDLGMENKFFKKKLGKGDASFRRGVFGKKHKKINENESQHTQEKEIQSALPTDKETKQTEITNVEEQNKDEEEKAMEKVHGDASELGNNNAKEKDLEDVSENSIEIESKSVSENTNTIENIKEIENKNTLENTKEIETENKNALENTKARGNKNPLKNTKPTENKNALKNTKPTGNNNPLENTKPTENKNVSEDTKTIESKNELKNTKEKEKEKKNLKELKDSFKKINSELNQNDIEEQYKFLKSMVGCKMGSFGRFPDVQDNHNYFECESDKSGCIKLVHKICPNGEVFSSRFLECVKPFFWKLVEREKRSLWKKEKKQQYFNTWIDGQSPNAWTDVTHEEGRQFPSELRPKCKPKLVVYHLKVKKSINEAFQKGKKEQRHILRTPSVTHSEISRKTTQKAANLKSRDHQLFPRSFIIRINKKEGGKSEREEKVAESDDTEYSSDEEDDEGEDDNDDDDDDDEEEDDEIKETSDEDEYGEDDDEDEKPVEKSGIKEFFKSAKEAITNRAKFNEPADTSFTLDKTNSYNKNKKLDGSVKDSKKILIDADIKVDKALGKTLKKILGKRRDKDDGNVSVNGNLLGSRLNQNLMESEQITMYENLIRSNPRLKRYFLVSLGETEN